MFLQGILYFSGLRPCWEWGAVQENKQLKNDSREDQFPRPDVPTIGVREDLWFLFLKQRRRRIVLCIFLSTHHFSIPVSSNFTGLWDPEVVDLIGPYYRGAPRKPEHSASPPVSLHLLDSACLWMAKASLCCLSGSVSTCAWVGRSGWSQPRVLTAFFGLSAVLQPGLPLNSKF